MTGVCGTSVVSQDMRNLVFVPGRCIEPKELFLVECGDQPLRNNVSSTIAWCTSQDLRTRVLIENLADSFNYSNGLPSARPTRRRQRQVMSYEHPLTARKEQTAVRQAAVEGCHGLLGVEAGSLRSGDYAPSARSAQKCLHGYGRAMGRASERARTPCRELDAVGVAGIDLE